MSGLFVTFEGIEGVGKSTLQKALSEALKQHGYSVVITREPGGTKLGEKLRDAILSPDHELVLPVTELLVMFAARAQHLEECIRPALKQNKIVLCDRFTDTTRAYQAGGRGLPMRWVDELAEMTHPGLTPDLTFWLDLPVDVALGRATHRSAADRIEQEKMDFFERAQKTYQDLAKAAPFRFVRLDAGLSSSELMETALNVLLSRIV